MLSVEAPLKSNSPDAVILGEDSKTDYNLHFESGLFSAFSFHWMHHAAIFAEARFVANCFVANTGQFFM